MACTYSILMAMLFVVAPLSHGQGPDSAAQSITTLKVQTRIVAVSAIVRDKSGQPVSGLTRDDFLLKEDGKPQAIRYLSQGSSLPLTLALMVDTSGSQRRYIQNEIDAGRAFFPAMLQHPEDKAVLVQFDTTILQLAHLTSSVTTLEHSLAYLTESHAGYQSAGAGHGGTLLYDAICAVAKNELADQTGRRTMVILTDGGDNGSKFSKKTAIEEAQRSNIVIYSVYYSDGGGDEGALKDLSNATGGRVFTVSPTMSLAQIYAEIASDMRLQYELGYPPPDARPNRYHKIQLTMKDKSMTVQAREGYFTPK